MASTAASPSGATPAYLVPRMDDLPTSNATYIRSAVITRVDASARHSSDMDWSPDPRVVDSDGVSGRAITFDPSGPSVFVGGAEGEIGRFDALTGAVLAGPIQAHSDRIWSIGVSPDRSRLASIGEDGTVRFWDPDTLEAVGEPIVGQSDPAMRISFGYDALFLARNGSASMFFEHRGPDVDVVAVPPNVNLLALRISETTEQGTLVTAAAGDGTVFMRTFAPNPNKTTFAVRHGPTAYTVANTSDGSLVASGSSDGSIKCWDPTTGEERAELVVENARDPISEVVFSPDGTMLASSDWGGRVRIWRVRSGRLVAEHQVSEGRVWAVAFNVDGSMVAAATELGPIAVLVAGAEGTPIESAMTVAPPGQALASARPATGVLLTHEQSWTLEGIAYGELLHSVCLAPGEITQIAISNDTQSVLANSADVASQSESLDQTGASGSSLDESENAAARESSQGGSTASSASASMQAGASGILAGFGVSAGASAAASSAVRTSYMTSARDVSDETNQSVHQSALDAAELARRRHTAAVREVSESDSLELQTRVVANYNHMHALTIQYYSAVQIRRLRTRVVDARRMLFIPIKPIDFGRRDVARSAIHRYRTQVVAAARAAGLEGPATWIELVMGDDAGRIDGGSGLSGDLRNDRLDKVWNRPAELERAVHAATNDLHTARTAAEQASDAELRARDAIRNAKDAGLADRAVLQRALQAASAESDAANAKAAAAADLVASLERDASDAERRRRHLEEILHGFLDDDAPDATEDAGAASDVVEKFIFDSSTFDAIETRVYQALADNSSAVNGGIWMRVDPSEFAALLEGATFQGERLRATLDPAPVVVSGSHVGFRWNHADPQDAEAFRDGYVGQEEFEHAVPLPTGGLFGEAVLGTSNSAEHLDITRFWNWSDALPPIRPTQIDPIGQHDEAPLAAPTLPDVPAAATDLGPISFPTVESGIPAVSQAMSNPDFFNDMSGTKAAAALAKSAVQLAGDASDRAGQLASSNYQRFLQLQRKIAEQTLDAQGQARKKSLDPTEAGAALNVAEPPDQNEQRGQMSVDGDGDGAGGAEGGDGEPAPGSAVVEFVEELVEHELEGPELAGTDGSEVDE